MDGVGRVERETFGEDSCSGSEISVEFLVVVEGVVDVVVDGVVVLVVVLRKIESDLLEPFTGGRKGLMGIFLHAALTVCINLVDELEIPEFMSNLVFFG